MSIRKVKAWAKHNDVNLDSISFYFNSEGEQHDSEFAFCDITGVEADVYWCQAFLNNGEPYDFQVVDALIGGALGELAGALGGDGTTFAVKTHWPEENENVIQVDFKARRIA